MARKLQLCSDVACVYLSFLRGKPYDNWFQEIFAFEIVLCEHQVFKDHSSFVRQQMTNPLCSLNTKPTQKPPWNVNREVYHKE